MIVVSMQTVTPRHLERQKAVQSRNKSRADMNQNIEDKETLIDESGKGIGVPSHVRTKVFIGRAAVPQDGQDKHRSEDAINGVAGDCLCDRLADLMESGGFLTQLFNPLELQ
ncbi:hypothetical protein KC343_g15610 [Hortaea werneckii]|nr:hypothetical protein KC317_g12561 [Hortaea werneckii]KAI7593996.1 hypothetical protein KC346_g15724 [Hortaea werneckii]KAI7600579.1 hypothetical protein KC343_g15610 [Hortaea werneckii]KAI7685696.1 hypothetical protein KC322_g13003 [Hortaea werneckii]